VSVEIGLSSLSLSTPHSYNLYAARIRNGLEQTVRGNNTMKEGQRHMLKVWFRRWWISESQQICSRLQFQSDTNQTII